MKNKKTLIFIGVFALLALSAVAIFAFSPSVNALLDNNTEDESILDADGDDLLYCTDCDKVVEEDECSESCNVEKANDENAINPSFCAPCGG